MEASRGSMCWLFWVLTYTHAFYQIPHPCINNAVLDYSSRIWIYLRRAPIKVQIGRSMRPTQTPLLISGVCCCNAVVWAWRKCCYTTQNTKIKNMNSRSAKFLCIYLSVLKNTAAPRSLDSLNLESVFAVWKHVCNPQERSYCYTKKVMVDCKTWLGLLFKLNITAVIFF